MRHFALHFVALSLLLTGHSPRLPAQSAPAGFQVELLYQAPEIEHPSVVTCDDQGNLFVGEDPMDMRGPTTEEFDRVLFIRFDESGKPVSKTVFCDQLSAVFGLIWHDGWLYVMHAPHYSRFKDTDGDGQADIRQDLAQGFGPPPGIHGFNDHIVTGTRLGLDGLVYVSVGDKGVQRAVGADGSTITLEGGGVVRMRLDGTQLEVVSSGTRNHLDVAMDSLDNIFTYDNTDDGLGWWTRFTHHIPTGYYGYPYDYHPHPERHLPRISEHGGGSPVGAACYRQAAWPAQYRDSAFHCEWGKRKIQRFALRKHGATFQAEMEDFMTPNEGSEFRPLDLCFSPDGRHMYVADWNYGGWTKPDVVGRLYRVTYIGDDVQPEPARSVDSDDTSRQLQALAHPAHSERMRAQHELARRGRESLAGLRELLRASDHKFAKVHAIWTLNALADRLGDFDPAADWVLACRDADSDVRAQAARALGQRRSPVGAGELVLLLSDPDAAVRMWAAIGLGRIGDPRAAGPLFESLGEPDEFARFAMIQALRAIGDWSLAGEFLRSENNQIAAATLLALTTVYDAAAVEALAGLVTDPSANHKPAAIAALAEVCRRADPYTEGWWGTQPARGKPARAKIRDWQATPLVLSTVRAALDQPAPDVRVAAIRAVQQLEDRESLARLREKLQDAEPSVQQAAIQALAELRDEQSVSQLIALASNRDADDALRQAALKAVTAIGSPAAIEQLIAIVADRASSPELTVLALDAVAQLKPESATPAVEGCLISESAAVRAKAVEALAKIVGEPAAATIAERLQDPAVDVRRAAIASLARVEAKDFLPQLIAASSAADLRFDAMTAVAAMPDRRALVLYLEGLVGKSNELRDACRKALRTLVDEIEADLIALHERGELTSAMRSALQPVVGLPRPIAAWHVAGGWTKEARPEFDPTLAPDLQHPIGSEGQQRRWRELKSSDDQGRLRLDARLRPRDNAWALAYAQIECDQPGPRRLTVGSDDQLVVWLNGQQVYEYQGARAWSADQDTIDVTLQEGPNHIWVLAGNDGGEWDFSLALEQRSDKLAFLYDEAATALDATVYRDFAIANGGDAERGRQLFEDRQGVACIKCHAVGGQGGQVGPDLASIGAKYPREELIRSVLEPSNRILTGYQLTIAVTADGEVLQGIVRSETDDDIEIVDAEARSRRIAKADIDEREESTLSMMPVGLKDGLTPQEFADLVAYLESLQSAPGETASQ